MAFSLLAIGIILRPAAYDPSSLPIPNQEIRKARVTAAPSDSPCKKRTFLTNMIGDDSGAVHGNGWRKDSVARVPRMHPLIDAYFKIEIVSFAFEIPKHREKYVRAPWHPSSRPRDHGARRAMVYTISLAKQAKRVYTIGLERVYTVHASDL